jgi:large subunit ribosomal protein L21
MTPDFVSRPLTFYKGLELMYAVIKTGGKQYRVSIGDTLPLEKLEGNRGDKIVFSDVLMVSGDDEEDIRIGTPLVEGASVIGEIVEQFKGPKIYVFKMKRRKGFKKKTGHRQLQTRMRIKEINI